MDSDEKRGKMKYVGIDFGTTNTVVAYYDENGQIAYLKDPYKGTDEIPTLLCCGSYNEAEESEFTYGHLAKEDAKNDKNKLISEFKRGIGLDQQNEFSEFTLSAEKAAEIFFRWLYRQLQEKMQCEEISAVVTHPVNFTQIQCEAIKRAAENGGFAAVTLYQEPVAAAVAYGMEKQVPCNILVYDFGGGTIDTAIVKKDENSDHFQVLGTGGNAAFGGSDITDMFRKLIYRKLKEKDLIDMESEESSYLYPDEYQTNKSRIEDRAEEVKCALSFNEGSYIMLQDLFHRNFYREPLDPITLREPITREEYPTEANNRIEETENYIIDAVRQANISKEDIDIALMSGGSSNIPQAQKVIEKLIRNSPKVKTPGTVIAEGALLLARGNIQITQIMTMDLGVSRGREMAFDCVIPNGVELPYKGCREYYLSPKNPGTVKLDLYTRFPNNPSKKAYNCDFADRVEFSIPTESIDLTDPYNKIRITLEVTRENLILLSAEVKNSHGETVVTQENIRINRESNEEV